MIISTSQVREFRTRKSKKFPQVYRDDNIANFQIQIWLTLQLKILTSTVLLNSRLGNKEILTKHSRLL
jgi:hypothetical protein